MKVESKIVAALVTTALALVVLGWLSFRAITIFILSQNWVSHSHEVISQLEMDQAIMAEADLEERGYLFTGDPKLLKTSQAAAARIPEQLQLLQRLIAINQAQQDALKRLKALAEAEVSQMNDRTAIFQKSGLQSALAKEPLEKTESQMNEVRAVVAQMRSTEDQLLVQRIKDAQKTGNTTIAMYIAGSALAVFIGLVSVLLVSRDLKLRSLTEAKLHQTEDRFRLMIAAVKDYAIFLLKPDGRVSSWNEGAQRIQGYTEKEIIGQPSSKFYTPEAVQAGRPQKLLAEASKNGSFEETDWRVRKDGSRYYANVVATAVRDTTGKFLGFVEVARDLTEQKRAGEIQQERDRYFELSHELICVAGFDGYLKSVNPAWIRAVGFSIEELKSRPFIEFAHPDDVDALVAEFEKLKQGGETSYFECRSLCKDGTYKWCAWSASSVVAQQIFYGTGRDITEQKMAQDKIEQLNVELQHHASQLESTNKELEAFSYSVSHDLRAPLRHIDGFVKMLNKHSGDKLDERGRRYLGIIDDSAQRMGVLIDDLLVFSRMSRAELRLSKVSTDSLVHEAVDGLQTEINGRQIHWDIGALPEVEADPSMLQQVWVNLISNAVKYTRPRQTAEIQIGYSDSDGKEYVFFVHDNGVGFDMQYADKLFGVFQRLHREDEFEGTGIGLANVSRIVHRHGGRVWAEGNPGTGATFYFSLPKKLFEFEI